MNYTKTIFLDPEVTNLIDLALSGKLDMSDDDTISHTIQFADGIEMDVKVCGSKDEKPYTEAVLFKNGSEIACSEVYDDFFTCWQLECDSAMYSVTIKRKETAG